MSAHTWCASLGDRRAPRPVGSGRVLLLGVIQSCFEAAMYIFVFLWTPALAAGSRRKIPHGLIFASFMVSPQRATAPPPSLLGMARPIRDPTEG